MSNRIQCGMVSLITFACLGLLTTRVSAAPENDRRAILGMVGEYKVDFHFRETTSLKRGYELAKPHDSDATEFVTVVEDSSDRIVLQHVLVLDRSEEDDQQTTTSSTQPGTRVVKHWRQEWRYEPKWTWQYAGNNVWRHRALGQAQRAGQWVQEVYQVDDSPRYASLGKWTHAPSAADQSFVASSWEGELTWRPLPQREWKVRSDYQLLVGRNRHTLTPTGWVHEQDNTKVVLNEQGSPVQTLVREWGHNVYDRRGEGIAHDMQIDFAPGYDYWRDTAPFWADVRQAWTERLSVDGEVRLEKSVDKKPLFRHLFKYASTVGEAGQYDPADGRKFIEQTLASFGAKLTK